MKKYLALVLGVIFTLGFAASAFAIHAEIPAETQAVVAKDKTQIYLGGEMRVRGTLTNNTSDFNSDKVDRSSILEGRIRLTLNAKITPNTEVMVEVRESKDTGDDDYTWGNIRSLTATDERGVYNVGGGPVAGTTRGVNLSFIQAWVQHKGSGLLGIPAGIKAGHMPLALGNKLFFDRTKNGEDAIVLFADPTKELHLGLVYVTFREGKPALNDDSTGYVCLFNYRTKQFGISGDITYVDDQNNFGNTDPVGAQNKVDANLWNFGLRGDTKISGFTLRADVEAQAGEVKDTGGADQKFRGYGFLAGVDYKIAPATLTVEYAYGSGDNNPDDGKFKTFVTALSNVPYYAYVYNWLTPGAAGPVNSGIANTQYLKGRVSANLTKDLNAWVDLIWLRANKVAPGVSKSIGTEIDAYLRYKIDRNLTYFVDFGYLFAGNFWKSPVGSFAGTGSKDPDNAYNIRHGLLVSF